MGRPAPFRADDLGRVVDDVGRIEPGLLVGSAPAEVAREGAHRRSALAPHAEEPAPLIARKRDGPAYGQESNRARGIYLAEVARGDLPAIYVPWIPCGSGRHALPPGTVVARPVRLQDPGPTVLGLAGLDPTLGEGRDLRPTWTSPGSLASAPHDAEATKPDQVEPSRHATGAELSRAFGVTDKTVRHCSAARRYLSVGAMGLAVVARLRGRLLGQVAGDLRPLPPAHAAAERRHGPGDTEGAGLLEALGARAAGRPRRADRRLQREGATGVERCVSGAQRARRGPSRGANAGCCAP